MKTFKQEKGFTIIEMILTIFIVTVGLLSVYGVSTQILKDTSISISRLTASYLAQEGIEIVRNIRDNNWIKGNSLWSDGLATGDYEADYINTALQGNSNRNLRIDNDGRYNYGSGDTSIFKRTISIQNIDDDTLGVSVLVSWKEKDKENSITVQENLYNWFPPL